MIKNVATLASGQMAAAAIPILAAPVLGRLYLPSDYGILAIYMSIASVFSAVGNWQYAQGIIVERYNHHAEALMRLCMWTSAVTSAVAIFVSLGIVFYPGLTPEWKTVSLWFLALPISTFIGGITTSWQFMANRRKLYGSIATIQIISVLLTVTVSIICGFLEYGYIGLMMAYFLGQIATFIFYALLIYRKHQKSRIIKKAHLVAIAKKYKKFAIFTTPTAFLENFSMQSPIYIFGLMGALEFTGLFNRARQLITMPFSILGSSIAKVFQRQAAIDYDGQGSCRKLYIKTFLSLVAIGVVPTIALMFWAPDLFEIYLGANWRGAGDIVRVLAPMLLLRLICSPLSTVFYIAGKQKEDFILNLSSMFLVLSTVFVAWFFGREAIGVLAGFAMAYSLTYVVFIVRSYQHSVKTGIL